MTDTTYVCEFGIGLNLYRTNIPSIDYARQGFWCDEEFDFTMGDNTKYWIPASAVRVVIKEKS
jgi:hypothetical protein